ncbi:MAG: type II secretion system F family protein [Patescibacteria group bacterium]
MPPKKKRTLSPLEQRLNGWVVQHLTRVSLLQKTLFVSHLKIMIHGGLSLVESLDVLGREIPNKKFQTVIRAIHADVEKGQQLSTAFARHPSFFPPMYVKMIEAGETAGKLEGALEQVASQMKKTYDLTSAIRGAMIYPAVILTAMIGIGIMMVTVVLPQLLSLFDEFDAELPLATRILIAISSVLSQPLNLAIAFALIIGAVTGWIMLVRKSPAFRTGIHSIMLKTPILKKIIRTINLARFSLTLSSLLKSAIPVVDAVRITAETCGNVLYKTALLEAANEVQTGKQLSVILEKTPALFPPMAREMIMVGERSGEVDTLLSELADFYNAEVNSMMKNFATIIEPVIIIVIGAAVGGMAVAVIMPMFTLVQNF